MKIEYKDIVEGIGLIVSKSENKQDVELLKWELIAYCLDLKYTAIVEGINTLSEGLKQHHC